MAACWGTGLGAASDGALRGVVVEVGRFPEAVAVAGAEKEESVREDIREAERGLSTARDGQAWGFAAAAVELGAAVAPAAAVPVTAPGVVMASMEVCNNWAWV